jgi:prepilin-type N-terminal cleavage/methylation domain-containing protein
MKTPRVKPPPNAFSMVELLVSLAITGLVIVGAGSLWGESSRMFQQLRLRNNQEAVVDDDIAAMEDLAYRYTCCPGTCTIDAAVIAASATCAGQGGDGKPHVGTEYYYFPYYAPIASYQPTPGNIQSVENLCSSGTLVDGLVTALKNAPLTDTSYNKTGIPLKRTVVVDNALLHRIRVDYTGTNLQRSTMLVPTAARWCP